LSDVVIGESSGIIAELAVSYLLMAVTTIGNSVLIAPTRRWMATLSCLWQISLLLRKQPASSYPSWYYPLGQYGATKVKV